MHTHSHLHTYTHLHTLVQSQMLKHIHTHIHTFTHLLSYIYIRSHSFTFSRSHIHTLRATHTCAQGTYSNTHFHSHTSTPILTLLYTHTHPAAHQSRFLPWLSPCAQGQNTVGTGPSITDLKTRPVRSPRGSAVSCSPVLNPDQCSSSLASPNSAGQAADPNGNFKNRKWQSIHLNLPSGLFGCSSSYLPVSDFCLLGPVLNVFCTVTWISSSWAQRSLVENTAGETVRKPTRAWDLLWSN